MIQNLFSKSLNLKKILLLLFSLLLLLSISILITTEVINSHSDSIQQSVADEFNKLKIQLEFKGLTNSIKEMTKDYSEMFDGYTNIIITDDNANILYNTNSGYISEKSKFSVLVDPWQANEYGSDIAYLIDNKNNIKYSTQLDISQNMNKIKELSSKNPLSKGLFSNTQDIDDKIGDKEIINADGTSYVNSSETKIIMNYEYIASKGLNLYSLYDSDHQYSNYYIFTNSLSTLLHWLIIFGAIFLFIFWILLPLWIFKDAKKHHSKARIWTIITFVLNILGLGIYLIFRSKNKKCIACNKELEDNWIICPYCKNEIDINPETTQNGV